MIYNWDYDTLPLLRLKNECLTGPRTDIAFVNSTNCSGHDLKIQADVNYITKNLPSMHLLKTQFL